MNIYKEQHNNNKLSNFIILKKGKVFNMYIDILDENLVKINRLFFEDIVDIKKFKKTLNINDIDQVNKDLLNNLDYSAEVYTPIPNSKDFAVSFFNNQILNFCPFDLDEVKGIYLSEIFHSKDQDELLIKKMWEVYKTGKPQKLFFDCYENDILYKRLDVKIICLNGFIYLLSKNNNHYSSLFTDENNLFDNDVTAIIILQEGNVVKCNQKYLELYGHNSYDEVIGKPIGYKDYIDNDKFNVIKNNLNNILKNKISSYTFPLELKKEGKIIKYFNVTCKPIVHNTKPAILAIYDDITKQEFNRIERDRISSEASFLEENLELIQSATNTGITYNFGGLITRSSKIYDMIERDPLDDDPYFDITWDFVVDEDKHILEENYKKLRKEKGNVDFIIRIKTAKGNLKYIHCFIRVKYEENNYEGYISFYKDVTDEQLYLRNLKLALKESSALRNNLEHVQKISKTAIGYYSKGLKYFKWMSEVFDLLEIDPEEYKDDNSNLIKRFVIDEDINVRNKYISKLSQKCPDIKFNQRIKTAKGNIKYLKTSIHQDYDDHGNLLGCVTFNQDITSEIKYQNQLKTALKDKEVLLTEVHHRVKNNLQIILSLINLDRNYESDPESILSDTENRIYAMALIHEKVYKTDTLSDVNIKEYIEALVNSLLNNYWSNIKLNLNIDLSTLNMDEVIPVGLIINELTLNTIKYAFPNDEEGNIYITFKKKNKHYILTVEDDGIGLPNDFSLDNLDNLGLTVV